MSNTTRYLKNANKSRKAISPVIATIILVAVAVVIAAAMAGFAGSLFGSYSQNAQLQIKSASYSHLGAVSLDIVNKGGAAETVNTISAANMGAIGTFVPNPAVIPANGEQIVTATGVAPLPTAGQTVTMTITTSGGTQYTETVTAQ